MSKVAVGVAVVLAALALAAGCGGRTGEGKDQAAGGAEAAAGGAGGAAEECLDAAGGCGGEAGARGLEPYARLRTACGAVEVNRQGRAVPICFRVK